MKNEIFHIIEDITVESGGLRTMVTSLHNHIVNSGTYKSTILTLHKEKEDSFTCFDSGSPKSWFYSKPYGQYLETHFTSDKIAHLHGVWMYPQYIASKIALQKKTPYIVTSHGMLEPLLLKDKGLKKQVYLKLFLENILKKATYLHAITPSEKENLYKLSKNKNIVEIPNLIHFNSGVTNLEYQPQEEYLLFLGRFHKIKGIDLLLNAFGQMADKKIKLYLVGFKNEYAATIEELAKKNNLSDRVKFIGKTVGEEKFRLYANAKAFVAPSYSEVIGMVNLEAAMCKTPVITTYNSGINPNWNKNGGLMINPEVSELVTALEEACQWSTAERIDRGIQLSNYVLNQYSWERKGHLWDDFYNSIK